MLNNFFINVLTNVLFKKKIKKNQHLAVYFFFKFLLDKHRSLTGITNLCICIIVKYIIVITITQIQFYMYCIWPCQFYGLCMVMMYSKFKLRLQMSFHLLSYVIWFEIPSLAIITFVKYVFVRVLMLVEVFFSISWLLATMSYLISL